MPLVLQLNAPLEGSEYDRILYIWACEQKSCQAKDGSIRAYRTLRVDIEDDDVKHEEQTDLLKGYFYFSPQPNLETVY